MKKITLTLISVAMAITPFVAMAQVGGPRPTIQLDLVGIGNAIANAAWIVFTIIAVVMFIIAGVLFLTSQGNAEKVQQARSAFLWGVAGVVVGILAFTMITIVRSAIG